jgi:hypothetical protein
MIHVQREAEDPFTVTDSFHVILEIVECDIGRITIVLS